MISNFLKKKEQVIVHMPISTANVAGNGYLTNLIYHSVDILDLCMPWYGKEYLVLETAVQYNLSLL